MFDRLGDWLFGESDLGVLKPLLMSLLLGVPLVVLAYQGDAPQMAGARFIVIGLGYPIYALLRGLWWDARKDDLLRSVIADSPDLDAELERVKRWRPALWQDVNRIRAVRKSDGESVDRLGEDIERS